MSGVKIFHSTKNYNTVLPGQTPKADKDVGMPALWTMIATGDAVAPCCAHHERVISLRPELFVEWAMENERAKWTLLYVNECPGDAPSRQHTFYKYVLFPSKRKDELLKQCKGSAKYEEVFNVQAKSLFPELDQFYKDWFQPKKRTPAVMHCHIGILGGSPFDLYQEENMAEWGHLRPDLPKVHQPQDDGDCSEPESLTFSEIFRKFAFEGEDEQEGEWTAVRSSKKAKDGCLPFCFESNTNIFPDIDGVFRHYCRAEATWRCKRKGCGRASKEEGEEGKIVRTTWVSFNSWYHQHLKDHEGQGLRKGFERQYCNPCWTASKKWTEGKICSFCKPGERGADDKSKKRPPHDQECCEMCQRLKAKGFDQSCFQFCHYVSSGEILVTQGQESWQFAAGMKPKARQGKDKK